MAMFIEARHILSTACRLCTLHHGRYGLLKTPSKCTPSLLSNVDYALSAHTKSAFIQKGDDKTAKRIHSDYIFENNDCSYQPESFIGAADADYLKPCNNSDDIQQYEETELKIHDEIFVKNKHLLDGKYLDLLYEISNIRTNGSQNEPEELFLKNGSSLLDSTVHNKSMFCMNDSTLAHTKGIQIDSEAVVYCDSGSSANSLPQEDKSHLPSEEELVLIRQHFESYFSHVLSSRHDYRLYAKDLVFENNYVKKPYVTRGLTPYVMFVAKIRLWVHFKYANVKLQVLKITHHLDDGTVRVRWRMSGLPQFRAIMFWKFLPWTYGNSLKSESEWLDGFSTFYVQPKSGLIMKHRLEKVIPDEETVIKNPKQKLIDKIRGGLNVGTV